MRKLRMLGIVLAMLVAGAVAAQGAPEQIQDALAAFNQRLGTALTLNDFFWTWEQSTFPDSALGCPADGVQPVAGTVVGYRFLFTYADVTYEYRVSADRTVTAFCGTVNQSSQTGGEDIAGVIDDVAELSNSLCPAPQPGSAYPRTRLAPGIQARVIGGTPNNLRSEPNINAQLIGQIPTGASFDVLAGPICDPTGMLWVQVNFNGMVGYTAEASGQDVYLEPLPPTISGTPIHALTVASAPQWREFAKLQGNFGPGLMWSSTGKLAVTGDAGAEGLWLYEQSALAAPPRTIRSVDRFVRGVFSDQRETLVLGAADGSVHIWDLSPSSNLIERLVLNAHNQAVSAVAISPDLRRIATSGGYAFATVQQDDNLYAVLVWDITNVSQVYALRGHTGEVTGVAFSSDGRSIATSSLDGSVRIWDAASGLQTARVDSDIPATAMAYSPDDSVLVIGYQDGATLALALVDSLSAGPVVPTHSAPITALTFSSDGLLLASAASDGSIGIRASNQLLTTEPPVVLSGINAGAISALAFSPDRTLLASLGADNTIRLLAAP